MIKTFIFDFGNVIYSFSQDHLQDIYVGNNKEDRNLITSILFYYWPMQDNGMPSTSFYEFIKEKLPSRLHQAAFNLIFHWKEELVPIEGIKDLIKSIKEKGYKLILLSNMPDSFSKNHDDIEELKHFDDLIFSCDIKLAKPDKKIFNYMLDKHNLKASECLFVDDTKDNIEMASKLGINSYLFDKTKPIDFINYVIDNIIK